MRKLGIAVLMGLVIGCGGAASKSRSAASPETHSRDENPARSSA